jgi:hypothetical protein
MMHKFGTSQAAQRVGGEGKVVFIGKRFGVQIQVNSLCINSVGVAMIILLILIGGLEI